MLTTLSVEANQEILDLCRRHYIHDGDFKEVYNILSHDFTPPHRIHNHIKHFKSEDGLLLYTSTIGDDDGWRLVVPNCAARLKLLRIVHESDTSAHPGVFKTYMMLSRNYYWKNMLKQIRKYVGGCTVCISSKRGVKKMPGMLQPLEVPKGRWQSVSMDFVSGIPKSRLGKDNIMVVVDRLTKRGHFIATTKDVTSSGAAELYFSRVFPLHGLPNNIVSDRDPLFLSRFWTTLFELCHTELDMSTRNHPESDGQTERVNQELVRMMRSVVGNHWSEWDTFLPVIEFAYNSSHHKSIKCTPFYADLGYEPRHPGNYDAWKAKYVNEEAEDFADRLKGIIQEVRDNMVLAQQGQEQQFNKNRRIVDFSVGDYVWVDRRVYGTFAKYDKMKPTYCGPYRIVKSLGERAFELDLPSLRKDTRTVNSQWLKKHMQGCYTKEPPRVSAEVTTRINQMNSIVGVRKENDGQFFVVNWKWCDPCLTTDVELKVFERAREDIKRALLAGFRTFGGSVRIEDDSASPGGESVRNPPTNSHGLSRDSDNPDAARAAHHQDTPLRRRRENQRHPSARGRVRR